MARSRRVRLDARALASAGASDVLALDPAAMAGTVALAEEAPATGASGAVALVKIEGPLAQKAISDLCGYVDGYDAIAARFVGALNDPRVGAVVLVVDSPGGDVAGLEEGVRRMRAAREAAGKPVAVYVDELCASAGYWLAACIGAKVYGPPSCRVGCIGVFGAVVDERKALEMEGIAVQIIRDPAGKAENHPADPIMDLAVKRAKERVGEVGARFAEAIASARSIPLAKVRGFDGALVSGTAAVAAGLLDANMTLEGVVEAMRAVVEMSRPAHATASASGGSPPLRASRPSTHGISAELMASAGLTDDDLRMYGGDAASAGGLAEALAGPEADPDNLCGRCKTPIHATSFQFVAGLGLVHADDSCPT